MSRPRLLDLFCGAGGCAAGYVRAGFDVVGVDHEPQPRYPFAFVQADALEYLAKHGREFDVIHASPPCQAYSRMRRLGWHGRRDYPELIGPTREALIAIGRPWVVENVEESPLQGVTLCGLMFRLGTYRHRRFESSALLLQPDHPRHPRTPGPYLFSQHRERERLHGIATVTGSTTKAALASVSLGIDWMTRGELTQAIPPAFSHYVGRQLLRALANGEG